MREAVTEQHVPARETLAFFAVAARTIPLSAVAAIARCDDAQSYEIIFASFRAELERVSPDAPSFTPIEELCSSCARSSSVTDGFCALCGAAERQAELLREQRKHTRGAQERSGW